MANIIHARKIEGEFRYRMWSTSSDEYVTGEMTEEELTGWLREENIQDAQATKQGTIQEALADYEQAMPARLERARTKGTSSLIHEPADLSSGWDMTWEEELAALEGPGVEVAKACLEQLGFDHSKDLAAMPLDESLGYAFTLLLEIGMEDPEEYLRKAGVLD